MRRFVIIGFLLIAASPVRAEVTSLEILQRQPFAGGKSFGSAGEYELLTGIVRFAVDPARAPNRMIVDLELAPRNKDGNVEFEADLQILTPKNRTKGNGAILYDVNNRGNKLALGMFNRPPLPTKEELAAPEGDGFLLKHGFTIVWSGWIGELLPGGGRLLLKAPQALEKGQLVQGRVRFEMSSDTHVKSLPLSRRDGHGSYPPTSDGEAKATMTMRKLESDTRVMIPREKFKLVRMPMVNTEKGVAGTLPQVRCELEGGFEPGVLYEVVYEAEGSIVQGLGLAGVRDLISFLKHDTSAKNPLHRGDGQVTINRAHGFGVSQSGRFLRHFLWQGFNLDERGRLIFDGLIPHVAGGGLGFFNHRFAQPTRHNGQHEDHAYPADMFPFTYGLSTDPVTGKKDGILAVYGKSQLQPKVMHTQSAAEYWHRAGSLVHTTPDGKGDAKIPSNVRIYAFGGTQHGPANDPPTLGTGQNLPNPADFRPIMRSLLLSLDDWVRIGKSPPASVYPTVSPNAKNNATLGLPTDWIPLVSLKHYSENQFPPISGMKIAKLAQAPAIVKNRPAKLDLSHDQETVEVIGHYPVLVPSAGPDGNDRGTLNLPDVAVPLATYTGWNLRRKEIGATDQLANLQGSYIPFTRTKAERDAKNDPRLSIEERYESFAAYVKTFSEAANDLTKRGYLRATDRDRLIGGRERYRLLFSR